MKTKKAAKKGKKISPAEEWATSQRSAREAAAKAYKERHKMEMEELFLPYPRDMFACHAMQSLMDYDKALDDNGDWNWKLIANMVYAGADAMMKARKAKTKA